eukprot:TRINITY_DN13153_c0_g1_i2.p1 TRINITY_DN13153_c0_g1~~TRINITY_DN13153_c0_g1_i2.p1  ORF type:complete len:160 (-),score=8.02 TRINITY_DN13153_c0_g1_i2:90-524(-)
MCIRDMVYFGRDGNHKISRLGLGYYFTTEFLSKKDLFVFMKEMQYWTKPSNCPPEISASSACPVVTLSIDIWSLGVILGELMSIGTAVDPPVSYSKQLLDLQAMMLNPRPQRRPTAQHVVNYLLQMAQKTSMPREVNPGSQSTA